MVVALGMNAPLWMGKLLPYDQTQLLLLCCIAPKLYLGTLSTDCDDRSVVRDAL